MRRALLGSLLALSSLACAEKETPLSVLVDANLLERNEQIDLFCDCFAEFGYASADECETGYGIVGPSLQPCVVEAYEQDETMSRAYLECVNPLSEAYTTCVGMLQLECGNSSILEVCNTELEQGLEECIELPQSVRHDIDLCLE